MAALKFTAANFLYSFTGDYVDLCAGKDMYTMANIKLCACITDNLPDSLPKDAEVASVESSIIKVLYQFQAGKIQLKCCSCSL